jgi:hypothetical protein
MRRLQASQFCFGDVGDDDLDSFHSRGVDVRQRHGRALPSEAVTVSTHVGRLFGHDQGCHRLVTLLLALVLGTLVGTTYTFFTTQKSELETLASRVLLVDQSLAQYGPEAKPARDKLKEAITQSYDLFWRGADADPKQLRVEVALSRWQRMSDFLNSLEPTTSVQKGALSTAKQNLGLMEQTRLLMSLQLSSPVAWSLVISVVAWSMFLFCGFGVLSGTNPTTIGVLALGSISVAGAMYLILDLSQPYSGFFRIPPNAIEQTIEAMDK